MVQRLQGRIIQQDRPDAPIQVQLNGIERVVQSVGIKTFLQMVKVVLARIFTGRKWAEVTVGEEVHLVNLKEVYERPEREQLADNHLNDLKEVLVSYVGADRVEETLRSTESEMEVVKMMSEIFHARSGGSLQLYFQLMDELFSGTHFVMEEKVGKALLKHVETKGKQRWSSHYDGGKGDNPENPQYGLDGKLIHTALVGSCPIDLNNPAGKVAEQGKKAVWIQLENSGVSGLINTLRHVTDFLQYKATGKNVGPHGYGRTDKQPLIITADKIIDSAKPGPLSVDQPES